jgi:hypothetical protein
LKRESAAIKVLNLNLFFKIVKEKNEKEGEKKETQENWFILYDKYNLILHLYI